MGRLSWRDSTARESWAMASTGHVEVAGEDLEAAADLGYLLLAVVVAAALPDHELQVVHHDQRERRPALRVSWLASRRTLARISINVTPAVSSIQMGASLTCATPRSSFGQSSP
jgi:hypothetical protein